MYEYYGKISEFLIMCKHLKSIFWNFPEILMKFLILQFQKSKYPLKNDSTDFTVALF